MNMKTKHELATYGGFDPVEHRILRQRVAP